jgi:hypothetical protein
MMMQYAVFQQGGPIYGLGRSPSDAEQDARDSGAEFDELRHERQAAVGDMVCLPCSDDLAAAVRRDGGNVRYCYVHDAITSLDLAD